MTEQQSSRAETYFDIDDTLAHKIVKNHLRLYNRVLGLGMSRDDIEDAGNSYRMTFDVPQIAKYREVNPERFNQVRNAIRTCKAMHRRLEAIPGASEGISAMVFGVHRGYFTVRPEEIRSSTNDWLQNQKMPMAEGDDTYNAVICKDPEDKVRKIINSGNEETTKFLFDDGLPKLIDAVEKIQQEAQPEVIQKLKNLVLVGFGYTQDEVLKLTENRQLPVTVLSLRSWQQHDIDHFMREPVVEALSH